MQKLTQKVCLSLLLGCFVGAIAACRNSPEALDQGDVSSELEDLETTEEIVDGEGASGDADPSAEEPDGETEAAATDNGDSENTVATGAGEVRAQPNRTPPPPLPPECSNPQDQQAMNLCAKATYERADAELNNAYQAVKAAASAQKAEQLQSAEEAWISFRDLYCEFVQTQFEGGSIQPMVYHGCLTLLTKDRTDALEQVGSASAGYESADQELNEVYQDLQTYLSAEEQDLLTDAQVAWIDYRDLHCDFEGGSSDTCLAEVTETRVRQLREQLDTRSL